MDMVSGTVIEKAEKYGIAVPVNRELHQRIKAIEAEY